MTLSRRYQQVEIFLEEKAVTYPVVFTENLFNYIENLHSEEREKAAFTAIYKNSPVKYEDYQRAKLSTDHFLFNRNARRNMTIVCFLSGNVVEWLHGNYSDINEILPVLINIYKDMGISKVQILYIAGVIADVYGKEAF